MASSRLKRKLEDVDHSTDLNESFVSYGTPLPSLADTKPKDKNEFVPVWQQEVRDEQGRKRLHGAFTGGFSAGYYNTVGSKEGWAPSTFKSSRKNKAIYEQRAEDFMDDEDLAERRQEKGNKIQTVQGYDPLTGQFPAPSTTSGEPASSLSSNVIDTSKFDNLIRPSTERIGDKLLQKMGWRPGQGIGPRISWDQRKAQAIAQGTYQQDNDEDEQERSKHLWPPLDRSLVLYPPHRQHEGVGFTPSRRLEDINNQSSSSSSSQQKKQQSKTPIGGAFGLGALEDADEDDIDFYQTMDRNDQFNFQESDINKPEQPSRFPSLTTSASSYKRSKDVEETFNDGTPVTNGFHLANTIQQDTKYPEPLKPPKGWKPDPNRIFKLAAKQALNSNKNGPIHDPSKLDSDKRREILGEKDIKGPQRSVFDYLNSKDKERLSSAKDASSEPAKDLVSSTTPDIPHLDPMVAKAALAGYAPFSNDYVKQNRYRLYLMSQLEGPESDAVNSLRPPENMTMKDFNNELQSFAQAARVFKPMSGMMAKRFTSASTPVATSSEPSLESGLTTHREFSKAVGQEEQDEAAKEDQNLSPAANAVRMNMFGPLTRTTTAFYPTRLVCKRFNVPDPWPQGPPGENDDMSTTNDYSQEKQVLNDNTMNEILRDRTVGSTTTTTPINFSSASSSNKAEERQGTPQDPSSVGLGEDDRQAKDVLSYKRPSMDIFEAIFADSDDDEEEGKEEEEDKEDQDQTRDRQDEPVTSKDNVEVFQDPFPPTRPDKPLSELDTETFKPKFKSKSSKSSEDKSKKKKKREKAGSKMSFAFDDDDDDEVGQGDDNNKQQKSTNSSKHKGKKKDKSKTDICNDNDNDSKQRSKEGEKEEEFEWIEKPPSIAPSINGRARALDFM